MELWVGPVIVAAVVSAVVTAAGWFVTSWQAMRIEQRRRDERVRDYQIALRAEIASDLLMMEVSSGEQFLVAVTEATTQNPAYVPFIPRLSPNPVFEALVRELHVLPGRTIDRVIHYARLRRTLDSFVEDLRSESYARLAPARRLTMYADYVAMQDRLEVLAEHAVAALDASLAASNSGAVPSTRSSGAEQGAAPGGEQDGP
jgi:hypothetical protein